MSGSMNNAQYAEVLDAVVDDVGLGDDLVTQAALTQRLTSELHLACVLPGFQAIQVVIIGSDCVVHVASALTPIAFRSP